MDDDNDDDENGNGSVMVTGFSSVRVSQHARAACRDSAIFFRKEDDTAEAEDEKVESGAAALLRDFLVEGLSELAASAAATTRSEEGK
jgi:hypothetical protein